METNKEVTIAVRVDKKIADELKKRAKEKELIFSKYIRRILVSETEKEKQKHNILDHLPIGMSCSSRDSSDIHNMFNSFREEHKEDVDEMKKIMEKQN